MPLGSVLGHLLFILFINDIEQMFDSNATVRLLAEDAKMYIL